MEALLFMFKEQEFKVRPVETHLCKNCGCAYDSIEEAICCPCYDDIEEYNK